MSCHCPAPAGERCPLGPEACSDRIRLSEAFQHSVQFEPDNQFELEQRRRIWEELHHG
jgi:hypothetical protein